MDYSDKIKKYEENISKSQEIINKEQDNIKKYKKEIEKCKNLEIQGLINDLNIPHDELKAFLKGFKK